MLRRRRPLARAAIVGGAAYAAGKHSADQAQDEAEQNAQIEALSQQQRDREAAEPGADVLTQLERLKQLLDDGVLTQDEFDAQKQKLLAST